MDPSPTGGVYLVKVARVHFRRQQIIPLCTIKPSIISGYGINNQGGCTNEVWFNTAGGNGICNYFPAHQTVINTPGKPTKAAENIQIKNES